MTETLATHQRRMLIMITNKGLEIGSDQDLFVDLDDKSAETISGGYEVFKVTNGTNASIKYSVDGRLTKYGSAPGATSIWTTYGNPAQKGIIKFDQDVRASVVAHKRYNLSNGGRYIFRYNTKTTGNPYDVDLYRRR